MKIAIFFLCLFFLSGLQIQDAQSMRRKSRSGYKKTKSPTLFEKYAGLSTERRKQIIGLTDKYINLPKKEKKVFLAEKTFENKKFVEGLLKSIFLIPNLYKSYGKVFVVGKIFKEYGIKDKETQKFIRLVLEKENEKLTVIF